jgi:hypothetical protein
MSRKTPPVSTLQIAENVLTYLGVKNARQAAELIELVREQVSGNGRNLTEDQSRDVFTVLSNFR